MLFAWVERNTIVVAPTMGAMLSSPQIVQQNSIRDVGTAKRINTQIICKQINNLIPITPCCDNIMKKAVYTLGPKTVPWYTMFVNAKASDNASPTATCPLRGKT